MHCCFLHAVYPWNSSILFFAYFLVFYIFYVTNVWLCHRQFFVSRCSVHAIQTDKSEISNQLLQIWVRITKKKQTEGKFRSHSFVNTSLSQADCTHQKNYRHSYWVCLKHSYCVWNPAEPLDRIALWLKNGIQFGILQYLYFAPDTLLIEFVPTNVLRITLAVFSGRRFRTFMVGRNFALSKKPYDWTFSCFASSRTSLWVSV